MNPVRRIVGLVVSLGIGTGLSLHAGAVSVKTSLPYRGWSDAIVLSNGRVEAVIVPSVGRWMQFRFAGSKDGPFWENPKLAGHSMPQKPWEAAHGSFGGDKTWPAPQSAWNWPPPDVFDAAPLAFRVDTDQSVVLTSPVSPRFGIRTERRFTLPSDTDSVRVVTTYEKVEGPPVEVGVWIITQTQDPVAAFLPIPAASRHPAGISHEWGVPTNHFSIANGLVRIERDRAGSHKIGNDSGQIVWVGSQWILRIATDRDASGPHPDDGCSTEIYTNPDPVPYVELETLGRLRTLAKGDRLSATNVYSLFRRQLKDPAAEARRVLTGTQ